MHPFLQAQLAALHETDLRTEAAAARGRQQAAHREAGRDAPADVVIRRTTPGDGPALAALSALDSAPMPFGPALVAEVAGAPRAVLPLDGGRAFGDPFSRTDELVALLELRAAQIRREERRPSRRRGARAWMSPAALRRFV
ncbi:MAG: hypothetical protein QOG63_2645 [Thermoleophilaceae bacterium]|jgi:hypothetical protein|nr:hypothetical protein [Thermoleophilaceae bacterium]